MRTYRGYGGLGLTAALNMWGSSGFPAVDALLAGADIIVAPSNVGREIRETVSAVKEGRLDEDVINERCRRVLFYKYMVSVPAPGRLSEINSIQATRLAERLKGN